MTAEQLERRAERAYTLAEAAEIKSVSVDTLRRAIHSTDPKVAHLVAKKVGRDYRVSASALDDWFDRLTDA